MSLRAAIKQHRRDQGKLRRGAHSRRKFPSWHPVWAGSDSAWLRTHVRSVECIRLSVSENRAVYTKSAGNKYALVD
jgi:hypothetical protein